MDHRALGGYLGLAMRCGKLAIGAAKTEEALQKRKAAAVIIDQAAADNTRQKIQALCGQYQVVCVTAAADTMGLAIGRPGVMVAAALSSPIAKKIASLQESSPGQLDGASENVEDV